MFKNKFQTGILLTVLVVPVFFYFFLTTQSENFYDLPVFGPKSLNESGDTIYHQVSSFSFLDAKGDTVSDKDFEEVVYVTDFFFTKCTSICPKMSTQLSRVQEYFKGNELVKILSHSVDPDYDKGVVLSNYATEYSALPNKWYFVTGDADDIYAKARQDYYIVAGEEDSDAGFVHSEKLVLIDKEKRIRGFYDGTDKEDVDRLIIEIQVLLHTYER